MDSPVYCAIRQHLEALRALANVVRGPIDVQQELGAAYGLPCWRAIAIPDVLTDRNATCDSRNVVEHEMFATFGEISALIKYAVGRQKPLVVDVDNPAA